MGTDTARSYVFDILLDNYFLPTPEELALCDTDDCLTVINLSDMTIDRMQMSDKDKLLKNHPGHAGKKCFQYFHNRKDPCEFCGLFSNNRNTMWIEGRHENGNATLVQSRILQENGKTVARVIGRKISDIQEHWDKVSNILASRELIIRSISVIASRNVSDHKKFTELLNYTASFIGASSSYIVLTQGKGAVFTSGIPQNKEDAVPQIKDFTPKLLAKVQQKMTRESFCFLSSVDSLKDKEPKIYELLHPWGIKNILVIPIFSTDTLIGFAVYHNVSKRMDEILSLSTISDALAAFADSMHSRKQIEKRLYIDNLTGLYNFEGFKIQAKQILKNYPDKAFALWCSDINEFRFFNEVFGFDKGDITLQKLSEIITATLKPEECSCRVNGDVMCSLLLYEGNEELEKRFKNVLKEINVYTKKKIAKDYDLNISCGIDIRAAGEKISLNEMINRAIMAKNNIKKLPHSNLCTYDKKLSVQHQLNMDIEMKMEKAMAKMDLFPYFQPQLPLEKGSRCRIRAEALARWSKPDGSIFAYPDQFIPVFERTGQIVDMDHHIYECVCKTIKDFKSQGINLNVSINVSRATMFRKGFIQFYEETRKKYGIDYTDITLEFTEDIAVTDMQRFARIIHTLHDLGFVCSMDDFGSGYSSLNSLQLLEMDELKLDKAFFLLGNNDKRKQIIVKNIIGLSSDLSMKTVAEGIENSQELENLKSLGCNFIQGYVYARPMPLEKFKDWVKESIF